MMRTMRGGAFGALCALALLNTACGGGDAGEEATTLLALSRPGPWSIPPATLAAGDAHRVPYTGAGSWPGRCAGVMKPGAKKLWSYLDQHFSSIRKIEGYACRAVSGSSSYMSVHGTGRALDLFITMAGSAADNDAGDPIANWLVENSYRIGVQYLVWDRTSWRGDRAPGAKSRAYTGASPHTDHIHVELSVAGGNAQTAFFAAPQPAPGSCTELPAAGGVVDEADNCFEPHGKSQFWRAVSGEGNAGALLWTNAFASDAPSNWARWKLQLAAGGEYLVEYFAVPEYAVFEHTRYTVRHDGQETDVLVDQSQATAGWNALGTFTFAAGGEQHVAVYDNADREVAANQHVVVDAIRLTAISPPAPYENVNVPDGGLPDEIPYMIDEDLDDDPPPATVLEEPAEQPAASVPAVGEAGAPRDLTGGCALGGELPRAGLLVCGALVALLLLRRRRERSRRGPWRAALLSLLAIVALTGSGCGDVEDDPAIGSTEQAFRHPPPPGSGPWTYVLTTYGGSSDSSAYLHTPACGGKKVDGKWWYSTGAYSFGCGSKLELCANGKCVVVKVVDNGPAAWVESKARARCGGSGYVIDASPLVGKALFGQSGAGWTDCRMIKVREVPASTPEGPRAPTPTCPALAAEGGELSEDGPCFVPHGQSKYWRAVSGEGHGGGLLWTNAYQGGSPSNWAQWLVNLPSAGEYKIEYYSTPAYAVHQQTRYAIRHAGQQTEVIVDLSQAAAGWNELATVSFAAGGDQHVAVYDNHAGAVAADQHIVVDALRLTRVGAATAPGPQPEPVDACPAIGAAGGVISEDGPCFEPHGQGKYWRAVMGQGHDDALLWTNAFRGSTPTNWARWLVNLEQEGEFIVEYFATPGYALHKQTRYVIRHEGTETTLTVDQSRAVAGWNELARVRFAAGSDQHVAVFDNYPFAVAANQHIAVDALRLTPAPAGSSGPQGITPASASLGVTIGEPASADVTGGCAVGRAARADLAPLLALLALGLLATRQRSTRRG